MELEVKSKGDEVARLNDTVERLNTEIMELKLANEK